MDNVRLVQSFLIALLLGKYKNKADLRGEVTIVGKRGIRECDKLDGVGIEWDKGKAS